MSPWWVVSGDTRSFNLTGLEENSDFVLSILARNSAGDSEVAQTIATTALASKLAYFIQYIRTKVGEELLLMAMHP